MHQPIIDLASLVLDFGKVKRLTCHQDGETFESDTDHTTMLGIIGSALAAKMYPDLDVGLVAQFALVHDLVEVYAGDTPTLVMGTDGGAFKEKEDRELAALGRIKEEFGATLQWIHETIEKYEALDTKEARFVKTLDKILPKITVALNNAKYINAHGIATREQAAATFAVQREKLMALVTDMPELMNIYDHFTNHELTLLK